MAPFIPIPIVNKAIVRYLLHPVNETATRHIAGDNCPIVFRSFLVVVMLSLLVEMNQSAIIERKIDEIHMARYGRLERIPF